MLSKILSIKDCKSMLNGGYLVRNYFNFDVQHETSYWFIIKDSFGGIDEVPSKYRSYVRKAIERFDYRRISNEELIQYGYDVYLKASNSYKVLSVPVDKDTFASWYANTTMELWGAFYKETGEMVAYATNTITEYSCNYNALKADPVFMKKHYVYYGLIFTMNQHYLEDRNLRYVNDGARSITGHSDIQPFLESKFKFRKAYCELQVVYTWWMYMLVNILYPFRKCIRHPKVTAILNLEAMKRGEM